MKKADVSGIKHLRELISYAKEKLELTKVVAERRHTSAIIRGVYVYDETEHPIAVEVTLNTGDIRAHRNGKADLVRAVNDLKDNLGVPVVRGIAQIKKSTALRPTVAVKKPAREKLTLFGTAKAPAADTPPTSLDVNPFDSLGKMFSKMHPIPDTHVLWILDGKEWKEEAKFTSPDGIERTALRLLRVGKPVKIEWAK